MGDSFAATPMHAWDTTIEARDTFSWQRGRHGLKFGGSFRRYIWPMWGFFQNRGFYQEGSLNGEARGGKLSKLPDCHEAHTETF